jgi:hypothetical protein
VTPFCLTSFFCKMGMIELNWKFACALKMWFTKQKVGSMSKWTTVESYYGLIHNPKMW